MLTFDRLKEVLDYDPLTGIFRWKIPASATAPVGAVAGSVRPKYNYRIIRVDNVKYYAHRLAWLYWYGEWPSKELDHINQNKDDNSIENLRMVTHSVNQKNQRKRSNNTSGRTGVVWNKTTNQWVARITCDGKDIALGYYDDFSKAVQARELAEVEYGFHKNHGR